MLLAFAAEAGSACSARALTPEAFVQADRLARRVLERLHDGVAHAAVIARVGADLSRYGLRFSHAAVVSRTGPGKPFRVTHLLNHCGRSTGALYEQGLINFFLDDPVDFTALLLVPGEVLQQRLQAAVAGPAARALFEPRYNMLAHPRSRRFQNSNQWLLAIIAAAQAPAGRIDTRGEAHDWLAARGFAPDTISIPALTRLGARLFKANVRFDDHPAGARIAGRFQVVTVRSVERYLAASEPGLRRELVSLR